MMKTEINGDWIGYVKRFRLPGRKAFGYPLKMAAIIFVVLLIVSIGLMVLPISPIAKYIPVFALLMTAVYFYIRVHYRVFWKQVLEESKGLFADLLMWVYYLFVCMISLAPALVGLYLIIEQNG